MYFAKTIKVAENRTAWKGMFLMLAVLPPVTLQTEKITSQTDLYLVNLSSKTYVFEDTLTKY